MRTHPLLLHRAACARIYGIASLLILSLCIASCAQVQCIDCTHGEVSLPAPAGAADQTFFPAIKYAHQPAATRYRHIYLEGDGNPWHKGRVPSANPTSQQKLALRLMLQDSSDSLYLDRPCYGYPTPPAPCADTWWTSARYSESVVTAMNEALSSLQTELGAKPLVLIGHSGGGTLALLLAERRNDVRGVVTLAGNLAPHAWAAHHGYLPLSESLTPEPAKLPATLLQWHYVGKHDRNIPLELSSAALQNAPDAELISISSDHNCCWLKHWPSILERLAGTLADDMAHK